MAADRNMPLDDLTLKVVNHYWLTGSFVHGTGAGHAKVPDIEVRLDSKASPAEIEALVRAARDAPPEIAFLRTPMTANSFALYINGRGSRSRVSPIRQRVMPTIPTGSTRARRARSTRRARATSS